MAVHVDDETRDRLIELAGGERKIGEYLNKLAAEEYARQTVTLESLAEKANTALELALRNYAELVGMSLAPCPNCGSDHRLEIMGDGMGPDIVQCELCDYGSYWADWPSKYDRPGVTNTQDRSRKVSLTWLGYQEKRRYLAEYSTPGHWKDQDDTTSS